MRYISFTHCHFQSSKERYPTVSMSEATKWLPLLTRVRRKHKRDKWPTKWLFSSFHKCLFTIQFYEMYKLFTKNKINLILI